MIIAAKLDGDIVRRSFDDPSSTLDAHGEIGERNVYVIQNESVLRSKICLIFAVICSVGLVFRSKSFCHVWDKVFSGKKVVGFLSSAHWLDRIQDFRDKIQV